ncbi:MULTISPECIES: ABC transporter permease [unclassified Lentimicrobium]|uniref:ABC transporter permease n=1 Tax=unclassified Lentimicrobium TaxID=2677434 RepID=UPI001552529D|nr:ABC transporter permease [Lentimicrobium sp. S6]NPD84320.1 ABC transporter permease [Lentimicrobium sp. L6]
MLPFILKRLLYGFWVLLGVATLVFFLFNILPGDPARMMLGQRADIASVEAINKELGRDKSIYIQYLNFLHDLSPIGIKEKTEESAGFQISPNIKNHHLQIKPPYLRKSFQSNREVTSILTEAFPKTLLLAAVSMGFALVVGVFLGMVNIVYPNKFLNSFIFGLSVFGMSLPSFFASILMAWLFAFVLADYTGLNLFGSLYEVDDLGNGKHLALKNLILPAITLGIRPLAIITELTSSSLKEVLAKDYIRTARAKGLTEWQILRKHALKNALNPIITTISGWFASLLAGAVFVEYVFDWKGMGLVIVNSLEKYDFPVLMGSVLFVAVLLILVNIVVDILYRVIDPRVELET